MLKMSLHYHHHLHHPQARRRYEGIPLVTLLSDPLQVDDDREYLVRHPRHLCLHDLVHYHLLVPTHLSTTSIRDLSPLMIVVQERRTQLTWNLLVIDQVLNVDQYGECLPPPVRQLQQISQHRLLSYLLLLTIPLQPMQSTILYNHSTSLVVQVKIKRKCCRDFYMSLVLH